VLSAEKINFFPEFESNRFLTFCQAKFEKSKDFRGRQLFSSVKSQKSA